MTTVVMSSVWGCPQAKSTTAVCNSSTILRGGVAVGAHDRQGVLDPEEIPVGAGRFFDPVGEKQHQVARLQLDRRVDGEVTFGDDPQGEAPALDPRLDRAGAVEDIAGRVPRAGADQRPRGRVEYRQDEGDESVAFGVPQKDLIEPTEDQPDVRLCFQSACRWRGPRSSAARGRPRARSRHRSRSRPARRGSGGSRNNPPPR